MCIKEVPTFISLCQYKQATNISIKWDNREIFFLVRTWVCIQRMQFVYLHTYVNIAAYKTINDTQGNDQLEISNNTIFYASDCFQIIGDLRPAYRIWNISSWWARSLERACPDRAGWLRWSWAGPRRQPGDREPATHPPPRHHLAPIERPHSNDFTHVYILFTLISFSLTLHNIPELVLKYCKYWRP